MIDRNRKGLIHIYEGDGKGKTTAAVGLCVRCAGSGRKVIFSQFLKDNQSSELKVLKSIEDIQVITAEKTFGFYFNMSEDEKEEAKEVYNRLLIQVIKQASREECDMLVLDEIMAAYSNQLIDRNYLLDFLKNKPYQLEVVLTGRNPAKELVELADYVSEVKKVKHPFDVGISARDGIEK